MCQDVVSEKKVDVILPVYKPDRTFEVLLKRLAMQTLKPNRVLIMVTECEDPYSTENLRNNFV